MRISCTDGILQYSTAIDIGKTVFCGQAFRWRQQPVGVYHGTVGYGEGERRIIVSEERGGLSVSVSTGEFQSFWEHYFDLLTDYSRLSQFAEDDTFFAKCLEYGKGIHILRQDPWETLASFVLSQNSNIPKIRACIANMVELCGHFPTPEEILNVICPADIRCGYRLPYLKAAAEFAIAEGFQALCNATYEDAAEMLTRIKGVGEKVCSCVILFGLHNRQSFPVDVWIRRVIDVKYGGVLTPLKYGTMAGIVQQYMFYYAIEHRGEFVV